MANRYYRPGPAHTRQVQNLFATIATRYDLINDVQSFGWHRRWKRLLLRRAQDVPNGRALDLCCGTGDIAFLLRQSGFWVAAVDFSLPMLRVAAHRAGARSPCPAFLGGDVLRLPFPDRSFDVATMAYGLRNLSDFGAGLREVHRVVRAGGRLVILDFGKPGNAVWRTIYLNYLRVVVPVFGWVFCRDAAAYAYILESLHAFPDAAALNTLLQQSGWTNLHAQLLLGGAMTLHWADSSG